MRTQTDIGEGVARRGPVTVRTDLMARLGVAARVARGQGGDLAAAITPHSTFSPTIRSKRLTLRPLCEADRAEFLRVLALSKGHLRDYCPLGSDDAVTDEQVFARQLALSQGAERTGRACRLAAFDREGRLVGGFNINDITRGLENTGELVLWVSADAVFCGYADEGAKAMMAHAFADLPVGLGLQRLMALITPENKSCRTLARKIGLDLCPTVGRVDLLINGLIVAHDVYEVFAPVGQAASQSRPGSHRVVEGKPSMAEELFGRGLLSILRTESAEASGQAPAAGT